MAKTTLIVIIAVALYSTAVRAEYVLTVNFINYTNPTGLCAECAAPLSSVASADNLVPVCCDDQPFRNTNCDNTGDGRCDTRFRWTIRPFGASLETRPVSVPNAPTPPYSFTNCNGLSGSTCPFSEMSTTFGQGPTGFLGVAANPLPVIPKTTAWTGRIQFFIEAIDSGLPNIIDSLLIDLDNLQLGADFTEEMTFNGFHNISHMTMSFRVECSPGFCGPDCTTTLQNNPQVAECRADGSITCINDRLDPEASCNSCLDSNFNMDTNCETCAKPNFNKNENCMSCLLGYDMAKNCTQCLPNRDPSTNCSSCFPNWDILSNCASCMPNRDLQTNCTQCLPNRDPSTNCQCLPNRDPSTNCIQCLPGRDITSNCTSCLPNRDPSTNCTQCLPGWDITSDCTSCLPNRDLVTNCSLCLQPDRFTDTDCSVCALPGGDPATHCQTCLSPGKDQNNNCTCKDNYDESTDCSTCVPGWDSNYDCSVCLTGRNMSTDCTTCIPGYSGEECVLITLRAPPPVDTVKLNAAYGTVIGVLLFVIITLAIMVTLLVCCYRRESYQRSEDYELDKNGAVAKTHVTIGDSRGVVELSEELNGESTEQKEEKESQRAEE